MNRKKSPKNSKLPNAVKIVDLSSCVPKKLYDRLKKDGIHMPCGRDDKFEEEEKIEFRKILSEIDSTFNDLEDMSDDKILELLNKQARRKSYILNIEPKTEERKIHQQDLNWTAEYARKMKKERIVWQTKLFKDSKEIQEKPLFEMTEELIDIAADHFSVWLKQMDDESNINKEFVKQLFSINVESDASKALNIETHYDTVISHDVANMINMPHLSLQRNLMKMLKKDKLASKGEPKLVAFGRSLPKDIKIKKFDENLDDIHKINCPEDLRSLKKVFESIIHLKSTQKLVNHLKMNPEMPRAKYLIENGMFDENKLEKRSYSKQFRTPLWKIA